jgi:dimethylaniline monooxygenase (N-oxide forming)
MRTSLHACVVGAGLSGLVAIKELLDEGHRVTCLERESQIGGNFHHPVGAAYDSMRLTVSQHFMAFSSFPAPHEEERRYWTRQEYADYLRAFSSRFGLAAHIRFGVEVLRVRRGEEGGFLVEHRLQGGAPASTAFDAVAICSGAHSPRARRMPQLEGAETFRGTIEHAATYRSADRYRGKRVVCLGIGETAPDVAAQIAEVATSCWISFRRYPALVPRYLGSADRPYTNDAVSSRLQHAFPRSLLNRIMLRRSRRTLADPAATPHERLVAAWRVACGSPAHQPFQKNDDFVASVLAGRLQVKPCGVERLDGDRVVFTDGSSTEADVVVCCTGFVESSPPDLVEGVEVGDVRQLYKHVFHPDLGARLAFIGWARPAQGGVPACSEMQSRLFALLCSGARTLPDAATLRRLAAGDREAERRAFFARPELSTLCSYTPYMESLAELVGCRPRLRSLLLDPPLAYRVLCGSNVAACYRLRGPHADPQTARRTLLALPVVYTPGELASYGVLYLLSRLGVLRERRRALSSRPPPAAPPPRSAAVCRPR